MTQEKQTKLLREKVAKKTSQRRPSASRKNVSGRSISRIKRRLIHRKSLSSSPK